MESSVLKTENLKPIILKVGVPVAVSLAGVIYAWIMAKKRLSKASPLSENEADSPETNCHQGTKHEESSHMSLPSVEDEEPPTSFASSFLCGKSVIHGKPTLQQEMVGLRNRIEQLEYCKSENMMLQRKVDKLLRKSKDQSRLIKDKSYNLQTRISVINKLENQNKELQRILDQLQDEKNELLKKLDATEKTYAFEVEAGDVRKEDYNQLLNELEQVKKERAARVEEPIHLRKSNTCLMRHNEQQLLEQDKDRDHIELEFEGSSTGDMHYDSQHGLHDSVLEHPKVPCLGERSSSTRRMLLKRLKRWVEGSEKVRVKPEERNNHDKIKCLDTHSVSYGAKEPQVPVTARRSCSSA